MVSTKENTAEVWGSAEDLPPSAECWKYMSPRLARDGDLKPHVRGRRRTKCANGLLAALDIEKGRASFHRIPGPLFGLREKDLTALVTWRNDPHFDAIVKAGREAHADAIWMVWPKRKRVQFVTLADPPRADPWTDLKNAVCE